MASQSQNNHQILLLDDSSADAMLLKKRLRASPDIEFDITEAKTLTAAKDVIAAQNGFDCLIVDYFLPDGTGLDFVRYVLNQGPLPAPVILLTGQAQDHIAEEAFALGIHECIPKAGISDGFLPRSITNAVQQYKLDKNIQDYQNRLERSNVDLTAFARTAAHDLKAPLRRIISYCEILESEAEKRLTTDDKELLERMSVNAYRMQTLIESLLGLSLIENNNIEKSQTDLNKCLKSAQDELSDQISTTGAVITSSLLPPVICNEPQIKRLFQNLLSNALKYNTNVAPNIRIEGKNQNTHIHISVHDNGIGIPEDKQQEIFMDFKRLHMNQDVEGHGLGLTICKKIVEHHNGEIWVDSEPGQGSTFHFTLKRENEKQE